MINSQWLEHHIKRCSELNRNDQWEELLRIAYDNFESARKSRIEDFTLDEIRARLWKLSV